MSVTLCKCPSVTPTQARSSQYGIRTLFAITAWCHAHVLMLMTRVWWPGLADIHNQNQRDGHPFNSCRCLWWTGPNAVLCCTLVLTKYCLPRLLSGTSHHATSCPSTHTNPPNHPYKHMPGKQAARCCRRVAANFKRAGGHFV